MTLPNEGLLNQVQQHILNRLNKLGERKNSVHYGCFLLCYKAGLRVSEAISFDLAKKNKHGLHKIPTKKRPERYVYIPKKVIEELKKSNWQPNQTNRWNFYHFLRRIKRELNIPPQIELTPHSLRRYFATQWANAGIPLPLLSKLLGHQSVRTTALYWLNIYEPEQGINPPNDTAADILLGKEWLEKHEEKPPSQPQPKPVLTARPPENTAPNIAENFSVKADKTKPQVVQSLISQAPKEKKTLPIEPVAEKQPQILNKTELTNTKPNEPLKLNDLSKELSEPSHEQTLLSRVRQLEEKLKQIQTENATLKQELAETKATAQSEKQRADCYESQLKTIVKSLYQWSKIAHYQQQEKAQKAQIVQIERPPPFRPQK